MGRVSRKAALDDRREGHQESAGQRIGLRVGHQRILSVQHVLSGNAAQGVGVVGTDLEDGAVAAADFLGDVGRQRVMSGARLRDCTLEQPLGLGSAHQHADAHAAGRLAEDRDIVGVAAELADVIADPLQRRDLVAHAVVAADCGSSPSVRAWL